jgi:glyoxylase-like metal-dependent hydrolase (beta-lactamase superfamily II)
MTLAKSTDIDRLVPSIARRQFLYLAGSVGALFAAGVPAGALSDTIAPGKITITRGRKATLHTYTAPEIGWLVNSHIIELPTQLIIVDAQYLLPCAREVSNYAKSLNKPISRIYITHYHPDHHLGAGVFDAPLYALPDVKAKIDSIGDRLASEERAKFPLGSGMIPDRARTIDTVAQLGSETLEGVVFELRPVNHAETEIALAVAMPAESMMITQDLVYNHVHLFLGERRFDGWKQALLEYKALPFKNVFPGHGAPGGVSLYDENVAYLDFANAQLAVAKSGDDFKAQLIKRYPTYGGLALLDHEMRFLFKTTG